MADIVFLAVAVGFFGLCVLYIRGCDRIIRGAEESADATDTVTS